MGIFYLIIEEKRGGEIEKRTVWEILDLISLKINFARVDLSWLPIKITAHYREYP